jgi:hypothetical protein
MNLIPKKWAVILLLGNRPKPHRPVATPDGIFVLLDQGALTLPLFPNQRTNCRWTQQTQSYRLHL